MSIIHTLKKFVDPITARREEADFKSRLEDDSEEHNSEPVFPEPMREDSTPSSFTCKLCGFEDRQGGYCQKCLADTMVPSDDPDLQSR